MPADNQIIEAPAVVFDSQHDIVPAFEAGKLDRDCVVVVRFQGPQANGMPELHKLMPPLGVLMDRGFKVALVTDGRLSGASGKVPSAIHVTPEAIPAACWRKCATAIRSASTAAAANCRCWSTPTSWRGARHANPI